MPSGREIISQGRYAPRCSALASVLANVRLPVRATPGNCGRFIHTPKEFEALLTAAGPEAIA